MPYYRICPGCGSNLDPGERCDCQTPISMAGRYADHRGQAPRQIYSGAGYMERDPGRRASAAPAGHSGQRARTGGTR